MSYTVAFVGSLLLAIVVSKYLKTSESKLDAIPTVGPNGLFSYYWGAFKYNLRAHEIIQEGYSKYKGKAFKIANWSGWDIIVSGPMLIEDMKKAPDGHISTIGAVSCNLKVDRTTTYQVAQLARSLDAQLADIRDEITTSFVDVLQLKGNEWVSIPAMDAIHQIICRTSNRALVGLPLCRDPEWIALNLQITTDVIKEAVATHLLPSFMAPYVVIPFMTEAGSLGRGIKILRPIVEEHQRCLDEYGSGWAEKPNNMLSWIMDEAKGEERSVRNLAIRIMTINFTANSDSSMVFTHALFYLAAYPQYINQLRKEVETVIEEDGWSKDALARMHKVDSFLKETLRLECIGFVSMLRKAMKDFTFSDGTVVPAGSLISIASFPTHLDNEIYNNPNAFEPFRFAPEDGEGINPRNQMTSINSEYLPFGLGRHACPGRFFISNVMKAMLAHIVVTYDTKLEDKGVRPANVTYGVMSSPNPKAKVVFRKRLP
ncbi:hypothetical protein SERLA73DRAFT_75354 [Serpula lacrymans var. lacrymans S7.3]|uniref:Cytochrome P450 n=2 Tax=Serpula lacrymans var. lacrymans TaxID=341189 RepID=F8Q3D6_SERL3|nr:putative monooxygenase [Serpula lacrymans var. lacrymans S7.9]EGN97697.1 hypothetical protein SERLA73DRAFT_75354 [Serpula lacrymans var. lacrymans S7.3]EGO23289.1 putative monooxygenase [Serpula lacrymans var. lacrymans S7.9]